MPVELIDKAIATLLTGVLVWAATCDIRLRMIPNRAALAVVALFVAWTAAHGGQGGLSGLAAGAIMFVAMTILYAKGAVGGGDSKLLSAVALFAGLGHLIDFLLVTTITGGVIALVELARQPQRAMVMFVTHFTDDHGPRVPYGAAIAMGGMLLIGSLCGVLPSTAEVRAWLAAR